MHKSLIERSSLGMHTHIFKTLLPHLQEVYKQAVCTKRFQMFHYTCQSDLTIVHQVYNVWLGFKVGGPVSPHAHVMYINRYNHCVEIKKITLNEKLTISLGPFCPDISFCISDCLQGGKF